MKKILLVSIAMVMFLSFPIQALATSKTANDIAKQESVIDKINKEDYDVNEQNFGLSTNILQEIRDTPELTAEEMALIDKKVDELIADGSIISTRSVAAVLGIIAGVIGIGGSLYNVGKYAAKQCKVKLGLTSRSYKANKIKYRVAITAAFGPLVALGFDDYFYGI